MCEFVCADGDNRGIGVFWQSKKLLEQF